MGLLNRDRAKTGWRKLKIYIIARTGPGTRTSEQAATTGDALSEAWRPVCVGIAAIAALAAEISRSQMGGRRGCFGDVRWLINELKFKYIKDYQL